MADENKKGITVKIDAALHAQVKEYIESRGMTILHRMLPMQIQAIWSDIILKQNKPSGALSPSSWS